MQDFLGLKALGAGLYFDADTGAGGGTTTTTATDPNTSTNDDASDDGDDDDRPANKGKGGANARIRELNKALKDQAAILETANKRLADIDAAEKKKQEDEALAKGEHEKLLKQRGDELAVANAKVQDLTKQLGEYEAVIKQQLEDLTKNLTPEQKELLEGKTPLDQVRWFNKALKAGVFSPAETPAAPNFNSRQPATGKPDPMQDKEYIGNITQKFRLK